MNKIQRGLANEVKIARAAVRLKKSLEADEILDPIIDEIRIEYAKKVQAGEGPGVIDLQKLLKKLRA